MTSGRTTSIGFDTNKQLLPWKLFFVGSLLTAYYKTGEQIFPLILAIYVLFEYFLSISVIWTTADLHISFGLVAIICLCGFAIHY